MRRSRTYPLELALAIFLALLAAPWAIPQETGVESPPKAGPAPKEGAKPFKPEEIDGFLAPIALYSDTLLSQVLMASTYPLEVVEVARWAKANKDLKGERLAVELEKKDWDPSVKSLINAPQVLSMMDEKLEWTRKLGDAFLAQKDEVMASIQRLRAKAVEQGALKTTPEQKVVVQEKVIVIESVKTEVIYVPTYDPTVVYGTWPYSAYPPYYYYPPGYVAGAAAISFGAGLAVGAAWGYAWGHCDWGHSDVDIDVNRNVNRNTNIDRSKYSQASATKTGSGSWQHDPAHRKGASYRDSATAQKFSKTPAAGAQSRDAYRGRTESLSKELSQGGSGAKAAKTSGAKTSGAAGSKAPSAASSSSAFGGYDKKSNVSAQSNRGSQSRQSSSASQSSSRGGSRAAPARSGGGGGRR